ncbi:MAG: energy-coupled thiamine transporter ThiT [Coriobacteriia bacterium]|nr:energy-coupled thiamine transporter ThiT [Coriobacteriia bacterium]
MSARSTSLRIHTLVEAGLCIALFAVLQYLNVRLPINIAGGTISFSMVPIVLFALLYGPGWGMVVGALCGLIDLMLEPFIVNVFQVFLDYPLAFACVGFSGLLAPLTRQLLAHGKRAPAAAFAFIATLLGVSCRFVPHFISGVIFFASNAPKGQNVYLYSATYNLSYLLPAGFICAVILAVVVPVILPLLSQRYQVKANANV